MRQAYTRGSGVHKEMFKHWKGEGTFSKVRRDDEFSRATGIFYTDNYSRRGECSLRKTLNKGYCDDTE